jgi:hypothetical protein
VRVGDPTIIEGVPFRKGRHPFLDEVVPIGLFWHLQALLLKRYLRVRRRGCVRGCLGRLGPGGRPSPPNPGRATSSAAGWTRNSSCRFPTLGSIGGLSGPFPRLCCCSSASPSPPAPSLPSRLPAVSGRPLEGQLDPAVCCPSVPATGDCTDGTTPAAIARCQIVICTTRRSASVKLGRLCASSSQTESGRSRISSKASAAQVTPGATGRVPRGT